MEEKGIVTRDCLPLRHHRLGSGQRASGGDNRGQQSLLLHVAVPHQSEVVAQSGLQIVKDNVSSPNSFSTMAKNQDAALILQACTRPYQ